MSAWRWQTAKAMARKYPSAAAGANRSVESERSTHGLTSCRSLVDLCSCGIRGPLLTIAFLRGARRAAPMWLCCVRLCLTRRSRPTMSDCQNLVATAKAHASTSGEVFVYSTAWCGDCRRARRVIAEAGLTYREIARLVECLNDGLRSVPTILLPDGRTLVEPTNATLAAALRSFPSGPRQTLS
jgi:mycoredoxin